MCGISGIIGSRPDREWQTWATLTEYRGPNDLGMWYEEDVLFAHNRLSIIDLSTAANQPMISSDNRYVIIFNGEIFNYLELRNDLEASGSKFTTQSDTEVLLEGFSKWGEDLLLKLDGMFAFAVWDKKTKQFFAARDHAGIKPFFYSCYGGMLIFSSEIKLVLESDLIPRDIRHDGIVEYLAYGYIPAPLTAFSHVRCLEAGKLIRFDLKTRQESIKSWWQLPIIEKPLDCSYIEATTELSRIFSQSVKRRLISDVPVGTFLSGGLDSSVIAAEIAQISSKKIKSFSIGYHNNPEYDESNYAEQVAAYLGVEHQTIYPNIRSKDLEMYLDLIIDQFDQPYANATVILTYILTQNIRDKVTVALIGDGADELFGGYPRYWAIGQQERFGALLRFARYPLLKLMYLMPETPKGNHIVRRLRRFLTASNKDLGVAFEDSTRLFPHKQLHALTQPKFALQTLQQNLLTNFFHQANGAGVTRACYTDQQSFLPNNLLEGADRMSMVNSFELRLPFLGRELMEFAAELPPEFKIKGLTQKRILKEAYRDKLPDVVFKRSKRGFNPPVWQWLRENRSLLEPIAKPKSRLSEYVNPLVIQEMLSKFYANMEDNSTQLWSLLVLDRWLARHV